MAFLCLKNNDMATKSRVNIKAYNDAYITTNDNGDISGKDAHDIFRDLADSALMIEDIINNDTTGGIDKPASAQIVKTHGIEIDNLQAQANTSTSEITRIEAELADDINGIDNAVDANTIAIQQHTLDFLSLVKKYGTLGRIRFNEADKHFFFEVYDGTQWTIKAEIGKSIIVDAVRLIKGEKPTDILPEELAIYNKEITLPNGTKTIRPMFVLPNGDEFGFIVHDTQEDTIVYRKNTGELVSIPNKFKHNGINYEDINEVEFFGLVDVLKLDKSLKINILNNIDDANKLPDRTYSSNKIEGLIPTPKDIVADINTELGNTNWQKGLQPVAIGDIDGGDSSVRLAADVDGGNSNN